jgi:hypothetical protein
MQEGSGRCEPAALEPLLSAQISTMIETGGMASVGVSQEPDVIEGSAA